MYIHPIQAKSNGIILVVQFLVRDFYMHVLILIFQNGLLVTMETAERWPLKTCETQTSKVYINFPKFKPNP